MSVCVKRDSQENVRKGTDSDRSLQHSADEKMGRENEAKVGSSVTHIE